MSGYLSHDHRMRTVPPYGIHQCRLLMPVCRHLVYSLSYYFGYYYAFGIQPNHCFALGGS